MDMLCHRRLKERSLGFLLLLITSGGVNHISDVRANTSEKLKYPSELYVRMSQPLEENLLEKKITISITDASVYDLVQLLRKEHHVPISFIDTEEEHKITIDLKEVSLRTVLENVVSKIPLYRFQMINNRLVLYPDLPRYHFLVKDINITGMKRFDAAHEYAAQLKRQFPEFMNFFGPALLGDPRHPVFTDTVTLKRESSVLDHFIQLLGENQTVVFLVIKAKSGVPMIAFNKIK